MCNAVLPASFAAVRIPLACLQSGSLNEHMIFSTESLLSFFELF